MPRAKWIDRKNATTFTLVHRNQQDPLIHDDSAPQMVFKELAQPNTNKIKTAAQLEEEYGFDPSNVRSNEGEAAMHGIYYDDTEYDYMQHMRDLGEGTEAVFVEAPLEGKQKGKGKDKGKDKMSLEDAIRADSESKNNGMTKTKKLDIPEDLLPTPAEELVKRTYQDQQDVPDTIKGFQPDMDPRLREVLTALEDEAYVDDEEDIFAELTKSGEASRDEFEDQYFDDDEGEFDDEDGWGSDTTEKATKTAPAVEVGHLPEPELVGADDTAEDAAEANDEWQREFAKFKKDTRKTKKPVVDDTSSFGGRTFDTTTSRGGDELMSLVNSFNNRKLKKKKVPSAARTETSGYSMSSSALHRTEGLTTLDDRFDKIEEEYARDDEDDDTMSIASSSISNAPERKDFDSIMDDFLGSYSTKGKRGQHVKRGKQQTGMEELDELRKGLGKARVTSRSTVGI